MFIIWQKQDWVVLTDILIAKSDEPNLILPKFARTFFCHWLFGAEMNIVR